ncbi:hypothetical protein TNCV_343361 [Trichonephila clavipes]|nr:hypothetical protein TNCV_343361 [Trichonephila clavipes]
MCNKAGPNMLYRIQGWRLRWPVHSFQIMIQKIEDIPQQVRSEISRIIVHQNEIFTNSKGIWVNISINDLIKISHSFMDHIQIRPREIYLSKP